MNPVMLSSFRILETLKAYLVRNQLKGVRTIIYSRLRRDSEASLLGCLMFIELFEDSTLFLLRQFIILSRECL
jgi:hypothetical protein